MRMVVTGSEGQVVRALAERASLTSFKVVPLGRPVLDLSADTDCIMARVEDARPDLLVSAAAYTLVDKAEIEADLAFAINEKGTRALAQAARRLGVPLIHLSTDYVFDGAKVFPYVEADSTGPTCVYGASKLAGEEAVIAEHDDSVVLRTAWVYSPFGSNFVKTMLRLAGDRDEIAVVSDQRGNPSSAFDIADGILSVAANLAASDDPERRGIFHMAGAGEASWAEFAQAIFAASAIFGGPMAKVRHIETADYPRPAKRPANSTMNCSKLARVHGVKLPQWRCSIGDVVARLLQPTIIGGVS